MRRATALPGLDPSHYRRHSLHDPARVWVEKNCYVDVFIEVVHALGLEPAAMLAFTLAVDFEGDQWTFFKPPHDELRSLYGLDVQELYAWRPLLDHALEHLGAGKFISTEADAYWLPDTAGTDYRRQHTKTTIILGDVDRDARRLGYFHNAGYFSLEGEDFAQLFRLDAPPDPAFMPMYAELIRRDRLMHRHPDELRAISAQLLARHAAWRSTDNPIPRFQARFDRDLPALVEQGLGSYHAWVFGTLRQLGAASELSALYLNWLEPDSARYESVARDCEEISALCKSLILKIARAVNARRALDASPSFDALASAWERVSSGLRSAQ